MVYRAEQGLKPLNLDESARQQHALAPSAAAFSWAPDNRVPARAQSKHSSKSETNPPARSKSAHQQRHASASSASTTHVGDGDDAEPPGSEAFLDEAAQVLAPILRAPAVRVAHTQLQTPKRDETPLSWQCRVGGGEGWLPWGRRRGWWRRGRTAAAAAPSRDAERLGPGTAASGGRGPGRDLTCLPLTCFLLSAGLASRQPQVELSGHHYAVHRWTVAWRGLAMGNRQRQWRARTARLSF